MRLPPAIALTALLLIAAACTDPESSDETVGTTTSSSSTTTTTTMIATTSSPTTTSAPTTTSTEPEETTTTSEVTDETSTTTRVSATTTSTTDPPADADPNLVAWSGIFRQPTSFNGFLEFQSNGVIRAGTAFDDLNIVGRWDYDDPNDEFTFTEFDFGSGCDGAEGRYLRQTTRAGGRLILLVEDPCQARVDFITQPGAPCQCFLYNRVELADDA